MGDGVKFHCLRYTGKWASLKYPWHTLDIMHLFLEGIREPKISAESSIDKSAVIQGAVIIEEGVKVFEHAKIVGPCYLGKNVIIGNNVILRESDIETGKRAWVFDGYCQKLCREKLLVS